MRPKRFIKSDSRLTSVRGDDVGRSLFCDTGWHRVVQGGTVFFLKPLPIYQLMAKFVCAVHKN